MNAPVREAGHTRDRGFTLVELLVVIIIIGILAAVAIPVFLNQRKKAVDASVRSDLRNLAVAYESWNAADPDAAMASTTTLGNVVTALRANGFKASPGNSFWIVRAPGVGFCFGASNRVSSAPVYGTDWMWYDTAGGGILRGGKYMRWAELIGTNSPSCIDGAVVAGAATFN